VNFTAITAIITIARSAIALAQEMRTIARQNAQLTPTEETELDRQIKALQHNETKPPHWRIEG
jgi:uncharacterized coiled-coil protein SlyX